MEKSFVEGLTIQEFCPFRQTIRILGKRWTILIIKEIFYSKGKTLRFTELKNRIGKVSTKVLSQRLKEMVADNLLNRIVKTDSAPSRVNYKLTSKGKDVCDIIKDFRKFGIKWGGGRTIDCKRMDCELCAEAMKEESN